MDHPREKAEFKMHLLKKFKDPLTRLANEGARISSRNPIEWPSSKSEFHQPATVRLQVEKKHKNVGLALGQALKNGQGPGN